MYCVLWYFTNNTCIFLSLWKGRVREQRIRSCRSESVGVAHMHTYTLFLLYLSPPVARSYLYATFPFRVFKSTYNSSVLAQVPRVLFHARSYPLSFGLFSEVGVLILTCWWLIFFFNPLSFLLWGPTLISRTNCQRQWWFLQINHHISASVTL